MAKVTLIELPGSAFFFRALIAHSDQPREAWQVRKYSENGKEYLEAAVSEPGQETNPVYRFTFDGKHWVSDGVPVVSR